jgi:hypothetical protein
MQQVRAKVEGPGVIAWEYEFERERVGWEPIFAPGHGLRLHEDLRARVLSIDPREPLSTVRQGSPTRVPPGKGRGEERSSEEWRLVSGLRPRTGPATETDQLALALVRPEAGSFVLVSVRRRVAGHSVSE